MLRNIVRVVETFECNELITAFNVNATIIAATVLMIRQRSVDKLIAISGITAPQMKAQNDEMDACNGFKTSIALIKVYDVFLI